MLVGGVVRQNEIELGTELPKDFGTPFRDFGPSVTGSKATFLRDKNCHGINIKLPYTSFKKAQNIIEIKWKRDWDNDAFYYEYLIWLLCLALDHPNDQLTMMLLKPDEEYKCNKFYTDRDNSICLKSEYVDGISAEKRPLSMPSAAYCILEFHKRHMIFLLDIIKPALLHNWIPEELQPLYKNDANGVEKLKNDLINADVLKASEHLAAPVSYADFEKAVYPPHNADIAQQILKELKSLQKDDSSMTTAEKKTNQLRQLLSIPLATATFTENSDLKPVVTLSCSKKHSSGKNTASDGP